MSPEQASPSRNQARRRLMHNNFLSMANKRDKAVLSGSHHTNHIAVMPKDHLHLKTLDTPTSPKAQSILTFQKQTSENPPQALMPLSPQSPVQRQVIKLEPLNPRDRNRSVCSPSDQATKALQSRRFSKQPPKQLNPIKDAKHSENIELLQNKLTFNNELLFLDELTTQDKFYLIQQIE